MLWWREAQALQRLALQMDGRVRDGQGGTVTDTTDGAAAQEAGRGLQSVKEIGLTDMTREARTFLLPNKAVHGLIRTVPKD